MIKHCFHDSGKHTFRYFSAYFNAVITILEDFGFDDWHETVLLAYRSIAGQRVGGLLDRKLRGHTVSNLEDCSPLGEAAAHFVELLGAVGKAVETCGCRLSSGAHKVDESFV